MITLFRKSDKSNEELEVQVLSKQTLLKNTSTQIEPYIKVLSLQSHSEYIELIKRLTVYEMAAYSLVPQHDIDCLYMLYSGRMRVDLSEPDDLDEFASRGKFVKKKKQYLQEEVPEGYLIDRQNMYKIFAIEDCILLKLGTDDITALILKHEQLLRAKRHFFISTFKPKTLDEKQILCKIADSLQLFYYEELVSIMQVNQKLDHLFLLYTGTVNLYTKRNVIMECHPKDLFNEECSTASYSAQVLSDSVQVFKLDNSIIQQLPESGRQVIEQSKKEKSILRRKLIENHIVDLQLPEQQRFKFKRQHKFRSMVSLEKLFKPLGNVAVHQTTTVNIFPKKDPQFRKKLSTGSIDMFEGESIQVLLDKNHFTSQRTQKSQASDKFSRTSNTFSKLLNFNPYNVSLTKSSKKVQSICLLPDMGSKKSSTPSLQQ